MNDRCSAFLITPEKSVFEALQMIDRNRQGFLIVIDQEGKLLGTLTDGDIRRAFITGRTVTDKIEEIYTRSCRFLREDDGIFGATEIFKGSRISFLPVVDSAGRLVNILRKGQVRALLLQDVHADLSYDFLSIDEGILDYEIFHKPWGFYKTTILNDYFQSKLISVMPGERLSLQSHAHREEHWIIVHGSGEAQIDGSVLNVGRGSELFIPKGAKHRLTNTDARENLIVTEVQIGEYLGEDDIVRYEDSYGRV